MTANHSFKDLDEKFGRKLVELRERAGLTQSELAAATHMSRANLAGIESGKVPGAVRGGSRAGRELILQLISACLVSPVGGTQLTQADADELLTYAGLAPLGQGYPGDEEVTHSFWSPIREGSVRIYSLDHPDAWANRVSVLEMEAGAPRMMLSNSLSRVSLPDALLSSYWEHAGDRVRAMVDLAQQSRRWSNWLSNIERIPSREIYSAPDISRYLSSRVWWGLHLRPSVVAGHVARVSQMLEEQNYRVGIYDGPVHFRISVYGPDVAMIEAAGDSSRPPQPSLFSGLEIRGRQAVRDFQDHFERIWANCQTEKQDVRRWFQRHLDEATRQVYASVTSVGTDR